MCLDWSLIIGRKVKAEIIFQEQPNMGDCQPGISWFDSRIAPLCWVRTVLAIEQVILRDGEHRMDIELTEGQNIDGRRNSNRVFQVKLYFPAFLECQLTGV